MAREPSKKRDESQGIEPRREAPISRLGFWPAFGPFGMMDRLFERMFEGRGLPATERLGLWSGLERFSPNVDIFERDGKLVIRADVPGLSKDDVNVDITDDAVIIEGERKSEHEQREEGVYRTERSYGHFRREIPLPEGVKTDTATANFKNGVLEVTMESPQPSKSRRRIQVQEGETGSKAA